MVEETQERGAIRPVARSPRAPTGPRPLFPQPRREGPPLARRQSPQTFEKRRREQDKKQKKAAKQAARIWRNAEKKEEKLRLTDPVAWRELLEKRRRENEAWYE